MAIDNSFMRKKIEKQPFLYVLFSPHTHLPFVECDPDTQDDQVYLFTTEEMTQLFAKAYTARKIKLQALRLPQKMLPGFFKSLYQYGVTAVQLQEEGAPIRVPLSVLAEAPDLLAMKNEKVPMANPELQLTGLYFMQELRRGGERDAEEKQLLKDLEEEMAHHLFRSRLIVAFDVSAVEGEWNPRDPEAPVKRPMLKVKDGRSFQPLFTDIGEARRFHAKLKTKLKLLAVPYVGMSAFLAKDCSGVVVNPSGFNLLLTTEQMQRLESLYQKEE